MHFNCTNCKRNCIFKRRPGNDEIFGAKCDRCRRSFCRDCARFSSTEIDTLVLTQRSLMFYCPDCQLKTDTEVLQEIKKLHDTANKLTAKIENIEGSTKDSENRMLEKILESMSKLSTEMSDLRESNKELVRLCNPPISLEAFTGKSTGPKPNSEEDSVNHAHITNSKSPAKLLPNPYLSDIQFSTQSTIEAGKILLYSTTTTTSPVDLDNTIHPECVAIEGNSEQIAKTNIIKNNAVTPPSDEESGNWEIQKRHRHRGHRGNPSNNRPKPLRGTDESTGLLKTASKPEFLFLSGLAPEVNSNDVMNFLKSKGLEKRSQCEKIQTKKDKYQASFRLTIPSGEHKKFMDANLWPEGVLINHFINIQRHQVVKNLRSQH